MTARMFSGFQVRKCQSVTCGLRYPCQDDYTFKERCPRCGAPTTLILVETLKASEGEDAPHAKRKALVALHALLDNVRSAWNVGSIFRSADGAGFNHLYLCGITPTPDYPAVLKTSLGAEKNLSWTQHLDGQQAARKLLQNGLRLWALENNPSASNLYNIQVVTQNRHPNQGIILVVGNEKSGVDPGILSLCELVLYLPMHGMKRSYNVAVAFGIAAHYLGWLAGLPAS
jgi:23S rRNA (guanosine2251-2'-O)-methyltransferase